jgi:hypothetical protein
MILLLWLWDTEGRLNMSPARRLVLEHLEKQNNESDELVPDDD